MGYAFAVALSRELQARLRWVDQAGWWVQAAVGGDISNWRFKSQTKYRLCHVTHALVILYEA